MEELTIRIGNESLTIPRDGIRHMKTLDDLIADLGERNIALDEGHVDLCTFVRALEYSGLQRDGTRFPSLVPPARMRPLTGWERSFFSSFTLKSGPLSIFTLLRVADYLGYGDLYNSCLLHIGHSIEGKDVDELRALLL